MKRHAPLRAFPNVPDETPRCKKAQRFLRTLEHDGLRYQNAFLLRRKEKGTLFSRCGRTRRNIVLSPFSPCSMPGLHAGERGNLFSSPMACLPPHAPKRTLCLQHDHDMSFLIKSTMPGHESWQRSPAVMLPAVMTVSCRLHHSPLHSTGRSVTWLSSNLCSMIIWIL